MGAPSLDHLLHELPRCARCGISVERLEQRVDAVADGRVVTVECHGDREVCVVRDADLQDALPGSFRYLLAFSRQAYQGWRVQRGPGSFEPSVIGVPMAQAPTSFEVDLRDSFRLQLQQLSDDALARHAYALYGVRRYEPPEGSE